MTPSRLIAAFDKDFSTTNSQEADDDVTGYEPNQHAAKSDAMRRIMGLDQGGLTRAVQGTNALPPFGGLKKHGPRQTTALPGLGNWDHSCYQNSVLQGLAALKSLPAFLGNEEMESASTKAALRGLTSRLNDEKNAGKLFWTPSKLKNMSSWQQQDAQEYFSKVMDEVEKDMTRSPNATSITPGLGELPSIGRRSQDGPSERPPQRDSDSVENSSSPAALRLSQLPDEVQSLLIRNPLEGLLAQRVGCQRCGYVEGLSLVPFNCLTVPLGKNQFYDVRQCLDDFTALEPISGVECPKCTLLQSESHMVKILETLLCPKRDGEDAGASQAELNFCDSIRERIKTVRKGLEDEDFSEALLKKCQIGPKNRVSTTKSRQAVIARAPKALTIHINRSLFNELTGTQSKNYANVSFPKHLGLGSWCLGGSPGAPDGEHELEHWNTDPLQSMLPGLALEEDDGIAPHYALRAVVTHYGRHENGHYICYRQSPHRPKLVDAEDSTKGANLSWWRLSDEDVSETSEENVLAQGGVFMLFYEMIEPHPLTMPPSSPPTETAEAVPMQIHQSESGETSEETANIATPTLESATEEHSEAELPGSEQTGPPATVPAPGIIEQSPEKSNPPTPHPFVKDQAPDPDSKPKDPPSEPESPAPSPELPSPTSHLRNPPSPNQSTTPGIPHSTSTEATLSHLPTPPTSPSPSPPSPVLFPSSLVEGEARSKGSRYDSPASTLSPRSGHGSAESRSGKAMESVAGFVQAN